MSPAARTVHLFGLYLVGVGLVVTLLPDVLFDLLGVPTTDEPWIRLVGVVVLALSVYYLVAARHELDAIIRATVPGRVLVGISIIVLVALWGYWTAAVFGLVDIAAALWTRAALRGDPLPGAGHPPAAAPRSHPEPRDDHAQRA